MSKAESDFEDIEGNGIWNDGASSRSAFDTARAMKWKIVLEVAIAAAGLAWISMQTPVHEHALPALLKKAERDDALIQKTALHKIDKSKAIVHVSVPKSSMRWFSDMSSTGASYAMITQTPEIAAAMQAVEVARAHIETGQDPQAAIARAARTIGYIPAVRLGDKAPGSLARVITGAAIVVSGDTIKVDDLLIHLNGVRAPDGQDICKNSDGAPYDCATWSKKGLSIMLKGAELSCSIENVDGKTSGTCEMMGDGFGGDRDVARIGVSSGLMLAVPGSDGLSSYQSSEDNAQLMKNGIWSGNFKSGNT